MKLKTLAWLLGFGFAAYLVAYFILASRPFQQKVFSEVRTALQRYGVDLHVESVEFSPFAPRLYLNRVSVQVMGVSPRVIPTPIVFDKIKVSFQPLALLSRLVLMGLCQLT